MEVDNATRAEWLAQMEASAAERRVRRSCASCASFYPNVPSRNGALLPPDGMCGQLLKPIENANVTECGGWQSSVGRQRERVAADKRDARARIQRPPF